MKVITALGTVGAGIGAGAYALHRGHLLNQAVFVARNPGQPWLALDARAVVREAATAEAARFGPGRHSDDAGDAFRHAYGSARLVQRAVHGHGLEPQRAARLVRGAGGAREEDGIVGGAGLLARAMDLRNNAVGVDVALANLDATPAALGDAVIDAIRGGRTHVIDGDRIRRSTAADL